MICYVFKPKRRANSVVVVSSNWHGALKLAGEARETRWCLETPDKREAESRLHAERIRREKERNGVLPPRPQQEAAERPLIELLDVFLSDLRVIGRAPATLKKYGHMRVMFQRAGWQKISDVTPRSFSEWRMQSGLAPRTLNSLLHDTGTFFRWLRRQRMASENPLEFVPPIDTRRLEKFRRSLTENEVRRLIAKTAEICAARAVVYLLAVYTGLRRKEIRLLTVEDFVLDSPAPFVRVRASTTKNAKESNVRLRPEVVEAVRTYLPANAQPGQRVFVGVVPRIPRFKLDLEAAGIAFEDNRGRRVDFHALRDTFGTHLAASGAAPFVLKEMMRHSTVQQSERFYIDAAQMPVASALTALPCFLLAPIANNAPSAAGA